jgi:hypothetical protein
MAIIQPSQLATGSYNISGSFSGSFQGNGAGLNNIPSSAIVGLSSTQIASGAVSASVSTGTGSFTVTSGSSTFMFVSSSGNVGVGTTTPASILDILDTTSAGSGSLSNPALNINQTWNTTGTPTAINLNVTNISSSNTAGSPSMLLDLKLNGSRRFRILSNGSIDPGQQGSSIGRTGYNDYLYGSFNSGGAHIGYHANSGLNGFITSGGQVLSIGQVWSGGPNAYVQFYANNSQVMRFTTTTNVLIGTTTDAGFKLDVNGTTRLNGATTLGGNTNYTVNDFQFTDGTFTRLRFQPTRSYIIAPNGASIELKSSMTSGYGAQFLGVNGSNISGSVFQFTNSYSGNLGIGTFQNVVEITPTGVGNGNSGTPTLRGLYLNILTTNFARTIALESTIGDILLGTTSGSVSIGTSTDTGHKLTVSGSGTSGSVNLNNTLYVSGSRVGIGTTTPSSSLHVMGSVPVISNLAQGIIFNNTLTAGSSSDILVGLDINPSFGGNTSSNWHTLRLWQPLDQYGDNRPYLSWRYGNSGGTQYDVFRMFMDSGWKVNFKSTGNTPGFIFTGGNLMINTTTDAGYRLDVNGTARVSGTELRVGNLQILTSGNASQTGQGIVVTGTDTTFQFNGSGGSNAVDMFQFRNHYGASITGTPVTVDKSVIRIYGGFSSGNTSNLSGNTLSITPTYNLTGGTTTFVRGIYYNPTLTSLTNGIHRAIETVTGDVILGSTSGRVAIGTTADTGHELLVSGSGASGSVNLDNTLYVSGSRVGIGGTPSAFKLDIVGTSSANIIGVKVRNTSTNGYTEINCYNNTGGDNDRVYFGVGGTATGDVYQNRGYFISSLALEGITFTAGKTTTGDMRFFTGGNNERLRIFGNGNVGINTTTDAGFKLDVNGTARVQGAGATSATSALTIQNSAGTEHFRVQDDGVLFVRSSTETPSS